MEKILYSLIFMMGFVDALGSLSNDVMIKNNSLDGVTITLFDENNKFVKTGSGPIFLTAGQSYPFKHLNGVVNVKFTFQHSALSFTIPEPTVSMNIISNDQIVTLINNSDQIIHASFYNKDNTKLNTNDCSLISVNDPIQLGAPIDRVYITKDVVRILIDLGDSLTFSIPLPKESESNIFPNDQLVKVTNNSDNIVNVILDDNKTIQFNLPGKSRYIPKTVKFMSILVSDEKEKIMIEETDFDLF